MDIDKKYLKDIEGIVISAIDYKDTSKIVKIFTPQHGIVDFIARGAKRPKSKVHNLISLYSKGIFSLKSSNKIYYLQEGEVIDPNFQIRKSIESLYTVNLFSELILRSLFENDVDEKLYLLYDKTLQYIDIAHAKIRLANMFLLKYISMIGYRPNLLKCINCGKEVFRSTYFSFDYGGIICEDCKLDGNKILLTSDEYLYLTALLFERIDKVNEINYPVDEWKINQIIVRFIYNSTDISRLKSLDNIYKFKELFK